MNSYHAAHNHSQKIRPNVVQVEVVLAEAKDSTPKELILGSPRDSPSPLLSVAILIGSHGAGAATLQRKAQRLEQMKLGAKPVWKKKSAKQSIFCLFFPLF